MNFPESSASPSSVVDDTTSFDAPYAPGVPDEGAGRRGSSDCDVAYDEWLKDRSPANMSRLLDSFSPTINSEITRYEGSKPLLRSKARILAIKAIKSFDPSAGARLQSWIVTNLKPLARYGQQQRDVKIPEIALRQAAEVNRVAKELADDLDRDPTDEEVADEIGISAKRVADVRRMAVASVPSGQMDEMPGDDGDQSIAPAVSTPSPLPFAQEAVYMSLGDEDKAIFDSLTGSHGKKPMSAKALSLMLGVSPAAISQRASRIGRQISEVAAYG